MKISPEITSQYTGDQIDPINRERLSSRCQREDRLYNQNNGHFIITTFGSNMTRDWIWTKCGLKVGDKIRAIQALSCTLPTKINKTRGNADISVKRCKCGKFIEYYAHILNNCELNHQLIVKRCNHLVGKIAKELKHSHETASVWIEQHWWQDLQLVKPDITMVVDGHCKIIELTCPYKTGNNYLDQRAQDKVHKYKLLLKKK